MSQENVTKLICDKLMSSTNNSFLNSKFNGIPENFLMNFAISLIILIIFLLLKWHAWKCQNVSGNIYRDGWVSLIYRDVYDLIPKDILREFNCSYKPLDTTMSYWKMLWFCFTKVTNEEMIERSGQDAIQYVKFLQHTLEYSIVDAVVVVVCVLPVNYQGSLHNRASYFGRTTAGNIDFQGSGNLLWMHVSVGFALFWVALCFLSRFSFQLLKYTKSKWSERTLILIDKKNPLTFDRIEEIFEVAIEGIETNDADRSDAPAPARIQDIKLIFEYRRLMQLKEKLNALEEALEICKHILNVESRRVTLNETCWCCGHYFRISESKKLMDGLIYYEKERDKMKVRVSKELYRLSMKPIHVAFVTFRNRYTLHEIKRKPFKKDKKYSYLMIMKAPDPRNIIWENVKRKPFKINVKTMVINTAVFFIAVFLTTPTVILSSADFLKTEEIQSNAVLRFIPTLVVFLIATSIAGLVTYSSSYLDFETRSAMNRSIILKTVFFLIFTVIILPSLGLTSINAFITWTMTEGKFSDRGWACIFLPDNGAFFVNYVMTSAFVGNVLQLLRLPEVFMCWLAVMRARSEAEKITIRKTYTYEFAYGVQYSYCLLMFTLVQFFSLLCPVLSPFGAFYFLVKLAVDRYNLCFANRPSRNGFKMHRLALKLVMFAIIMKYAGLFFLIYIRGGAEQILTASEVLVIITIIFICLSMNPCRIDFLPRILLMPHEIYRQMYHDYDEEEEGLPGEEDIYQPYSLRRYIHHLTSLDRFGNPIPNEGLVNRDKEFSDQPSDEAVAIAED